VSCFAEKEIQLGSAFSFCLLLIVVIIVDDSNVFYTYYTTERFKDLDKLKTWLNLVMVVWFKAEASFHYCPAASKMAPT